MAVAVAPLLAHAATRLPLCPPAAAALSVEPSLLAPDLCVFCPFPLLDLGGHQAARLNPLQAARTESLPSSYPDGKASLNSAYPSDSRGIPAEA